MRTISIVMILLASPAFADRCVQRQRVQVVQQQHVQFVQPVRTQFVVLQAPIFYGVGINLQYQMLQSLQAPKYQPQQAPTMPVKQMSMIEQKCMRCHTQEAIRTNDAPLISITEGLSPGFITKSLRAISTGKMPKNGKLTNAEMATLMQELLDLEKK